MNTYTTIRERLLNLFSKRFPGNTLAHRGELFDTPLFGADINLQARDLLYLFFDVEREFGITITENMIIDDRFLTINSITGLIYECHLNKTGIGDRYSVIHG
ncbi:MAG: peptide maturation system acyl carrier-related protein [Spirochaetales bacterium]|nr:peptide maturation system acyl carrier-related protein [Spirochaetales bacterium]